MENFPTTRSEDVELRKQVVEGQTGMYSEILGTLMERSGNNADLANSMRNFLQALERRSAYGNSESKLSDESVEKLTQFFEENASQLDSLVGNRS